MLMPDIAKLSSRVRVTIIDLVGAAVLNRYFARYPDFDDSVVPRNPADSRVDENFEQRSGECLGRVDDAPAR